MNQITLIYHGKPEKSLEALSESSDTPIPEFLKQDYSERIERIYKSTMDINLTYTQLNPITLNAKYVLEVVLDSYFPFNNQGNDFKEEYLQQNSQHKIYKQEIESINAYVFQTLIKCLQMLNEYLDQPQSASQSYIQKQLSSYIVEHIQFFTPFFPKFIKSRQEEFITGLISYKDKIVTNIFETMDILISQLLQETLHASEFIEQLQQIFTSQMDRISYDLFDLTYSQSSGLDELFQQINETNQKIIKQFFDYQYYVSSYAIKNMEELNQLLEKYQTLANVDTYKVFNYLTQYLKSLQTEVSTHIINNSINMLKSQSFNIDPKQTEDIAKQSIRHFYYLSENLQEQTIQIKFKTIYEHLNLEEGENLTQNVQIFDEKPDMYFEQQEISLESQINALRDFHNIVVIKSQHLYKNEIHAIKIKVRLDEIEEYFIVQSNQQNKYFVIYPSHLLNPNKWIFEQEEIHKQELKFVEFIEESFEYLNSQQKSDDKGKINYHRKAQYQKDLFNAEELEFKNPALKKKKITVPQRPLRYGTSTNFVTCKAIGAGLGCLIVDCLDEDIPWEDKLRNAGFTTMTVGMLGLLASRLPLVGLLIQQVILVYAIKLIMDNKVISSKERRKNLGHLGAQVTLGVGFTIAGGMFIPIPFWGSIIGGVMGGIAIGLYSKFMIPYAMQNLLDMLDLIQCHITKQGYLPFREDIVISMRFDLVYFQENQPEDLESYIWLTLLVSCLVNEIKYLIGMIVQNQENKIMKKINKNPNDTSLKMDLCQVRQIKVQSLVRLGVWSDCRRWLKRNHISIFSHAKEISSFLDGMLINFKVY